MFEKDYKIRIFCVLGFFFLLYAIVVVRLFLIQLCQKDFFKELAQQQYRVDLTLDDERALIFDRNKKMLVINREVFSAFILPHQLTQAPKTYDFLKQHFPEVYQKIEEQSGRYFFWLERKLTPERLAYFKSLNNDDIHFLQEPQRFYPHPALAHLIGFTDIDNNGIAGIELAFSKRLRGSSSQISIEKDARSGHHYFEKRIKKQGYQGESITLTIDSMLQFFAYEQLKETVVQYQAQAGSVLIMNPDSGEILTMVNYPTFDPNSKAQPSLEVTKNEVVTGCYEFGSVMKMFAALAALDQGVVTYDEEIDCEGKVTYLEGFRVENPWRVVHIVPFHEVVKYSSNIGIAKVALRLGSAFYDHLSKLGFGKKTGIEFPGERSGFVNHPDNWSRSSPIVMSFGYEVMSSLLQLGVASSIILNGGYAVEPVLIKEPISKKNNARKRLYKQETIDQMKTILEAIGSKHAVAGYRTMGKTGTARMVDEGVYSTKKHLYTYVGMIERDNYRRVVVTFIREPVKSHLWASEVAAPLFKKIAERMVMHECGVHASPISRLG